MSLRLARRAAQGGATGGGGGSVDVAPSVPISEIRARKWTKQLKTVGHLSIPKWVPDQENPTEALHRGGFKKTKGGRKRPTGEIGRMTRSVRQHLDAPLELLSEFPSLRNNSAKQVTVAVATSAQTIVAATANAQQLTSVKTVSVTTVSTFDTQVPAAASASSTSDEVNHQQQSHVLGLQSVGDHLAMHIPASGDHMLPSTVPSDEQLEMALDDLPMLDSDEDLPFDSLTEDQVPPVVPAQQHQQQQHSGKSVENHEPQQQQATKAAAVAAAQADESVENTAESTAEGDDDDDDGASSASSSSSDEDDDDDDNGSAISGSPMPSPSPQSSPMMSPSPSP